MEREEDGMNPTIRKISKINLIIEKNPVNCSHQEGQMSTYNQEAPSFPTLSSRKIKLISVIRNDRCQPCNQEGLMSVLQNHKSQKKKNHQVKKLIILIIKKKNEKNLTIKKFSK